MTVSAPPAPSGLTAPGAGQPVLKVLSLGAGVQSSVLLLLAAEGHLPGLDVAIFADTGWEPRAVYEHLDRLEREIAEPAGIPILRVSSGNIRDDALDPAKRFASMPLHILNPDGGEGMSRRQCTGQYKIRPIKEMVRELLNCPHPVRIPAGVFVEQWIGISTDEFHRAKDADVAYMKNRFPLIEQGFSRSDCLRLLRSRGFGSTPKSSCLGCLMWNRLGLAWSHGRCPVGQVPYLGKGSRSPQVVAVHGEHRAGAEHDRRVRPRSGGPSAVLRRRGNGTAVREGGHGGGVGRGDAGAPTWPAAGQRCDSGGSWARERDRAAAARGSPILLRVPGGGRTAGTEPGSARADGQTRASAQARAGATYRASSVDTDGGRLAADP